MVMNQGPIPDVIRFFFRGNKKHFKNIFLFKKRKYFTVAADNPVSLNDLKKKINFQCVSAIIKLILPKITKE